jgi:hypothetical protein
MNKHIGNEAMVDVTAVGHDPNGATAQELFQPLFGGWSCLLIQFRCIDAAQPDAFASNTNGVSINCAYLKGAQ